MSFRHHSPTHLYNDPADSDAPGRRIIYAVSHRATLDLKGRDPFWRLDAWLFYKSQGIDPEDVLAGRVTWEWLYR